MIYFSKPNVTKWASVRCTGWLSQTSQKLSSRRRDAENTLQELVGGAHQSMRNRLTSVTHACSRHSQYGYIFNKEGESHHRKKQERTPRVPAIGTQRREGSNWHSGTLMKKNKKEKNDKNSFREKTKAKYEIWPKICMNKHFAIIIIYESKELMHEICNNQVMISQMKPQAKFPSFIWPHESYTETTAGIKLAISSWILRSFRTNTIILILFLLLHYRCFTYMSICACQGSKEARRSHQINWN